MRQVILAAIRPALTILLVVCALSCAPKPVKTPFSPVPVGDQGRLSLGGFEHRGERYELWDLMDAGFRAGNDGLFVRDFSPSTILVRDISSIGRIDDVIISDSFILASSVHEFFEDHTTRQCVETQHEE